MTTSTQSAGDAEDGLRTAAEQVVTKRLGQAVKFSSMVCLTNADRRSAVYRCTDEAGQTYIVKRSPKYSPESLVNWAEAPWEVKGFFNDWIGAEFLSGISGAEPVSPRFYGGDAQAGFFVLEDLGEHHSLVDPLLHGDAPRAENSLLSFAASLGRMHARTAGRVGEYTALYRERFPGAKPFATELEDMDTRIEEARAAVAALGVPLTAALEEELHGMMQSMRQPGPFLTFIHADPCPDNEFDMGIRNLLIDFELGHYGHALYDAVYPRMIWPSCWCANRLPDEVVQRWEARYREELARGVPEAREDALWEDALLQQCGFKLMMTLNWHIAYALREDYEWGIATLRQRILSRLAAFIASADEFRRLPALRAMASELLPILRARWAETPDLPLYPAFR